MKRQSLGILVAAIGVLAAVVIIAPWLRHGPDVVRIGVVLPLSGDAATYGVSLRTGADLALRRVNTDGGIGGHPVSLIYEDSKASPKDAVTALNKLISIDKTHLVIGGMFSHTTIAMGPVAQRSRVVLLSPTASAMAVPQLGDYVFSIYPSDAQDGRFLASALAHRTTTGATVAVVFSQVEAMETCKDAFAARLNELGHPEIVLQEPLPQGAQDLTPVVARIAVEKPDWVFLATFLPETAQILRKAHQQALDVKFLGISTCYDPKLFELAGSSSAGLLFSAPAFDESSDVSAIRQFVKEYEGEYGRKPDVWAAYGYDAVMIAAESLRRCAGDLNGLRDALGGIRGFEGATGTTTIKEDGSSDKSLRLLTVDSHNKRFLPSE